MASNKIYRVGILRLLNLPFPHCGSDLMQTALYDYLSSSYRSLHTMNALTLFAAFETHHVFCSFLSTVNQRECRQRK